MRKINWESSAAFVTGKRFRMGNTRVLPGQYPTLVLHGNPIARYRANTDGQGDIEITLAGWNTVTTRSRLSSIPGVSVSTRRGVPMPNGVAIDSHAWYPFDLAKYMLLKALGVK